MLIDARTLPADTDIETDLCIVGSGVAGLTLAQSLAPSGLRMIVLEGGGLDYDPESQELYAGRMLGNPAAGLDWSRLRYFGGTSNHWGGYCRPLDPLDFAARPWVPDSGWPIDADVLAPYYARSVDILDIAGPDFSPATWAGRLAPVFARPDLADALPTQVFQQSPPTRFGEKYRPVVERGQGIDLHLWGNVVELETDDTARTVSAVRVACLAGNRYRVRARWFVLATGGIENARLLLASNAVATAGLGNGHDLVGRYFMDHPSYDAGTITFDGSSDIARNPLGAAVDAGFGLPPEVQEQEELLNFNCYVRPALRETVDPPGYAALRELSRSAYRGRLPAGWQGLVGEVAADLGGAAGGLWQRLFREPAELVARVYPEVAPAHDSRVVLSTERDALGVPRADLDWRISEIDRRTIVRGLERMGAGFARAGLGRLRIDDWMLEPGFAVPEGSYHHIGTTRMADEPRRGVVDRDCRVHGTSNLYVAGSSVFPTSGHAPPTMTIVALTLRLADHLAAAVEASN
jgi:choline dehydrogenase-like flavoprotein